MSLKEQAGLKLVPFNTVWISHDKIDIHAIYRRPRFVMDEYGEWEREIDKDGLPTWDLTGGLPVKQHNKWMAKGFQYITLADTTSLVTAGLTQTIDGNWRDYHQHQSGGPWNYKKYAEGVKDSHSRDAAQLRADVLRFGAEAVEQIRRQTDPMYTLPKELRLLDTRTEAPVPAEPALEVVPPGEVLRGNGGKFVKKETVEAKA